MKAEKSDKKEAKNWVHPTAKGSRCRLCIAEKQKEADGFN